jgi:hypothetical protein
MPLTPFTNITAVRMIWQDANVAIGETYYNTNAPSQTGGVLYNLSMNLFKARSLLMGNAVIPVSVRMSLLGTRRSYIKCSNVDVQPVPVGGIAITVNPAAPFVGQNTSNVVDGSAAQGPDAILVDVYGSASTSHARKYLAGCPNVLIRTNPVGPWIAGDSAWYTLFQTYSGILTAAANGWVLKTVVPVLPSTPPVVPVFSLDSTNTYLQVTVPTIAGAAIGSLLTLHGCKMTSKAYKAPNGNYAIRPPAPFAAVGGGTTYTLQLPFAQRFPFLLGGYGYCGLQVFMADTYSAVNLGREGEHRRGNSVLAPRGRRKTAQQISS